MKKYKKEELESLSIEELEKIVLELQSKMKTLSERLSICHTTEEEIKVYAGVIAVWTTIVLVTHVLFKHDVTSRDCVFALLFNVAAFTAAYLPEGILKNMTKKATNRYEEADNIYLSKRHEMARKANVEKAYGSLIDIIDEFNKEYILDENCEYKRDHIWTQDLIKSGLDESIVYSSAVQQLLKSILDKYGYDYRLRIKEKDKNNASLEFYLRYDCYGTASLHYSVGRCVEGKLDEYACISCPNYINVYMDDNGVVTKAQKTVVTDQYDVAIITVRNENNTRKR